MQKPINFTKCSSGPIEKNFSLTFGSTSKQTKAFLTKTFYHGPSHRSPSILQAHLNPQPKQFLLGSKVEVILISAGSALIIIISSNSKRTCDIVTIEQSPIKKKCEAIFFGSDPNLASMCCGGGSAGDITKSFYQMSPLYFRRSKSMSR